MKIAVFKPATLPFSIESDIDNIARELGGLGADVGFFSEKDHLPEDADVFWNPGCGRPGPTIGLLNAKRPLVVTFHGAANLALPLRECFGPALRDRAGGWRSRRRTRRQWRLFEDRCAAVVAVSGYAREEFRRHLGFVSADVSIIPHGIDHAVFFPAPRPADPPRYFLHVSSYQQYLKNLPRIFAAYRKLPPDKPKLIAVAPGYRGEVEIPGIELIRTPLSRPDLADLYRAASCFVFPSLRETFGHPIVEAMASGCPVITSDSTACAETAGDAAIRVNPRSVEAIAWAMESVLRDGALRADLRNRGLVRARRFSWQKSAGDYLELFNAVLSAPP